MGVVEGNKPATDNDWESIAGRGEPAIKKWISDQLVGKSCAVVLIGTGTAGRKWIKYEIETAWNSKKGLLGIHIHNLKNLDGTQSVKGNNPFNDFTVGSASKHLSSIVKTYDPPYSDSKQVYAYIKSNLETWIETAISIRNNIG
jgi:hypothetical protein